LGAELLDALVVALALPDADDDDDDFELLPHAATAVTANTARTALSTDLPCIRMKSSSTEVVGPCGEIYATGGTGGRRARPS
jgi:hypothetical protein